MKHSIVTITPLMAQQMLESNTNNRKLDENIVAQFAKDMSYDKWQLNGETIKFANTGRLLDGQHRLHAVVRTGKDLVTMMVEGLDENVFTTIDVGKKRNASQILQIAGYADTNSLAGAVRYIYRLENKRLGPTATGKSNTHITAQQVLEWVERHTFVLEAAKEVHKFRKAKLFSYAIGIASYYLMYLKDAELCQKYFNDIYTGANLSQGDPALTVRNRLARYDEKYNVIEQFVFLIRGWNALRKGEKIFQLKGWTRDAYGNYLSPEIE